MRLSLSLIGLLYGIHALRVFILNPFQNLLLLMDFAFWPERISLWFDTKSGILPLWSPLSYAVLHGSWEHLFWNALGIFAFGTLMACRLRALHFLLLSAVSAVGGAVAHLVLFWGKPIFLIGASAVVAGYLGAMVRFLFAPGGLLGLPESPFAQNRAVALFVPALPLKAVFVCRPALIFIGLWMTLNILFATNFVAGGLNFSEANIAWHAHIGGFLAGLLYPQRGWDLLSQAMSNHAK